MAEHYLVVYYDNGTDENGNQLQTIHLWPGKSVSDCNNTFARILNNPKFEMKILGCDIIDSEEILKVKRDLICSEKKACEKCSDAETKKKPKEEEKTDYSKMSKAELKDILEKRGVKTLYHDTMDVLRQKCLESEKQ